jgi:hypothetical protein
MDLEVVVCHFKEDLQWLQYLKHPYVIYNKNPNKTHLYENNLPNYGFDTITYLTYIIKNYYNLPNYVCFAQDHPFDHCANFVDLVNNFNMQDDFCCLGFCYERHPTSSFPAPCALNSALKLAENLNIICQQPLKYISSAQCIVSKNLILKRSLEDYIRYSQVFPQTAPITYINYSMEYLWPTILGFADNLHTRFFEGSMLYKIQKGYPKLK